MEILRTGTTVTATIAVGEADTAYDVAVLDLADMSSTTTEIVSSSSSEVAVSLSAKYDNSYLITIDGEDTEVHVVRPYVDAEAVKDTQTEIDEYADNELVARAIIDSIIPEGFYYKKVAIETTGLGADYLPVWQNVRKVLKVYENNILIYDLENADSYDIAFNLSDDKSAIVQTYTGAFNRAQGASLVLPAAESDILDTTFNFRGFPRSFDYTIVVEAGYRNIPTDIVKATKMLIDDISCGKLDYYKRYISDYSSEQFKMKFSQEVFEGTGNILVDKILSKYAKSIRMLGVL